MRRPLATAAFLVASYTLTFAQDTQSFDRIERGRYLSVLGDCAACHTAPGGQPFAGGLGLQTPFGKIVAPNITPDRETGIGSMTDQEFLAALHDGRGHDGTRLYPAMPYPAYTKMTDDDVLAMRAYFATVAPVSNRVISNQLPFPFNVRLSMAFWNSLNFTPGRYRPNAEQICGMEPRRLYRRRCGALRHMSYAEDPSRRRQERPATSGCDTAGVVRARHYDRCPQGHRRLVEGRSRPISQDRYQQLDVGLWANGGGCHSLHVANDGRRYFCDRDLSER